MRDHELFTPTWIEDFVRAHDGGWFYPFVVAADHPILTESWLCLHCNQKFFDGDVALLMPFYGADASRWTATHRECAMAQMGILDL